MKVYLLMFTVFVFLFSGCKEDKKTNPTVITTTAKEVIAEEPEVTSSFTDLEGNPVELTDYKGKRVLLNFWATWCKPCIEEMPSLLEAQDLLATENYIFLVASDQSMDKIKGFKEKKGFEFNWLKFNGTYSDLEIAALPATFIYNEAGEMVHRIDGATAWSSTEIMDLLKGIK